MFHLSYRKKAFGYALYRPQRGKWGYRPNFFVENVFLRNTLLHTIQNYLCWPDMTERDSLCWIQQNKCIFLLLTAFYISWHTPFMRPFPFLWVFYKAFFVLRSVRPEECALNSSSQCSAGLLILHFNIVCICAFNIVAPVNHLFFNHTTCGQTTYHSNFHVALTGRNSPCWLDMNESRTLVP